MPDDNEIQYWAEAELHPFLTQQLQVEQYIHVQESEFQKIEIFTNPIFGRVLALDGVLQTTESDEFIYHETFAHIALLEHPSPENVLIIGGGDGGLCEEVLKHPGIQVTQVEIDSAVIDVSKKYLASICGTAFENPRNNLIIGDAIDYVKNCGTKFDVILIDSTDPKDFSEGLFALNFFRNCSNLLRSNGILVTQLGCPFVQRKEFENAYESLAGEFLSTGCFHSSVPSYNGGPIVFAYASKSDVELGKMALNEYEKRYEPLQKQLKYLSPIIHAHSFVIPEYLVS